jgi:hypothetical protein
MNSNKVINDEMTLEEKLAAIDALVASQTKTVTVDGKKYTVGVDPADLTMCEGCQ